MKGVENVDVLVVGAGPAGSCAARAASEAGAKVLLVESARWVGGKPHCAEYVPMALALEIDFPERCVVQKVNAMETILPGKRVVTKAPGFILDRVRFDRGLAESAAMAGVEIRCATRFTGFQEEIAYLSGPDGPYQVRAASVVAADGASSKVRRTVGFPSSRLLTGVQIQAPLVDSLDHTLVFFDPAWRNGYAWLFPKGPLANVGLGMTETSPGEAWKALETFARRLLDEKLIRPGYLARTVGAIPVDGPAEALYSGNVLFAGDAAVLTHPITGAGIPQAVLSGLEAGKAAANIAVEKDPDAGYRYEQEVRDRYGRMLAHALNKRILLETSWMKGDFDVAITKSWPAFREYRA